MKVSGSCPNGLVPPVRSVYSALPRLLPPWAVVDHGKLGVAARLDRLGKVGKLRFHLLAVGAYLRGVTYGGTAAAHFLGGVLPTCPAFSAVPPGR